MENASPLDAVHRPMAGQISVCAVVVVVMAVLVVVVVVVVVDMGTVVVLEAGLVTKKSGLRGGQLSQVALLLSNR